jgi:hypothetical protein
VSGTRVLVLLVITAAFCLGLPGYTGYSGAPGSSGECAGACHGSGGGTVAVRGFPSQYTPGQAYVVSVVHTGGSSISNFNASARRGGGSTNAGTITAGYRTETYNVSGETNGIHLSSANQDSCTFTWTAPTPGIGDVTLYVAGHQGGYGGANTAVVLTATQGTGIEEQPPVPTSRLSVTVSPTVVSNLAGIRLSLPPGSVPRVLVLDRTGRVVSRIAVPASSGTATVVGWQPLRTDGTRLSAGSYLLVAICDGLRVTCSITVK